MSERHKESEGHANLAPDLSGGALSERKCLKHLVESGPVRLPPFQIKYLPYASADFPTHLGGQMTSIAA
jgi:hypothetical protein